MYLPLDRSIHTDFGNIVCDGRYQRISSSSTMLLFFLLFGVRPNRYLTYRTNIYVDRAFLYFQSTDCALKSTAHKPELVQASLVRIYGLLAPPPTFYFMLRTLEDLATCATRILICTRTDFRAFSVIAPGRQP
jgi:hypothetical protein